MSDHAEQKSESNQDQKLLSSNANINESCRPYQAQWMSRWMQTASSSHSCKHHVVSDASNKVDQRYLVVGSVRSKKVNMLSEDINRRNTFDCITMEGYNRKELNQTSNVLQSGEVVEAESNKINIISNSVVRGASSFDSKEVLSSKSYIHHFPDFPKNQKSFTSCHFMDSENVSSEWGNFPMLDINRKMEIILGPKKSGPGIMPGRISKPHLPLSESTLAPHVMKFASEEHRLEAHSFLRGTDQGIKSPEYVRRLLPYQDYQIGSSNSSVRYEYDKSNISSCMCIREENDPFMYKEHFASKDLTYMDNEICKSSSHPAFMVSKSKNGSEMIAKSIESSWSGLHDGSMQLRRDYCPGDTPLPCLSGEHGWKIKNVSVSELLHNHITVHGSSKVDNSGCAYLAHKMLKCSKNGAEVDNVNIEPQRFSNATQYLLITNKMGADLSQGDQMIKKPTNSTKFKGTASFEMPSSHVADLPPPISSTGEDREDGNGIDTHFIERHNGSSGLISSDSGKGLVSHNVKKSKSKAGPPVQQAFFNNAACATLRELNPSGTESMGADQIFSKFAVPDNKFNPLQETASSPEPSNRSIKHLRHNPFDSCVLAAKRAKTGGALYSGQAQNLFKRIIDHNKSGYDMLEHLGKKQEFGDSPLSTKCNECSSAEKKAMHNWIQRWCCGSQQATPHPKLPTTVLCEPVSSEVIHEKFEGKQLPSIMAMAFMWRAAKKFHPCKFQRKGSLVSWNTEGL